MTLDISSQNMTSTECMVSEYMHETTFTTTWDTIIHT